MSLAIDDNDSSSASTMSASGAIAAAGSYQRVNSLEEEPGGDPFAASASASAFAAKKSLRNFLCMSVLFSANHGCVVSCLALASSRLGTSGAWQSGILYLVYSASSVLGATYVVKTLGARNSMVLGMACYCFYVGCFYLATLLEMQEEEGQGRWGTGPATLAACAGAVLGGIGAGCVWTAQGAYFGLAGRDRAALTGEPVEESNARLAGYFAFWYLALEVVLRLLSSLLAEIGFEWDKIFGIYTLVTIGSTLAMLPLVRDYPKPDDDNDNENDGDGSRSVFRKVTVAGRLLVEDPKMKHMIGLNAAFGFASAFLNSYVNGQVLPVALDDPDSRYVGVLTSTVAIVAAASSLVFGRLGGRSKSNSNPDSTTTGDGSSNNSSDSNGRILVLGALCFGGVILPFVVQPDATHYGWRSLLVVYCLHGIGRATFEGTLRSTFADYFSYETEGAFANIILQNGIASGIGYILTFALTCDTPARYCIEYQNGSLHDVWTFEVIALASVVLAIGGYLRASALYRREQQQRQEQEQDEGVHPENELLRRNRNGVSA